MEELIIVQARTRQPSAGEIFSQQSSCSKHKELLKTTNSVITIQVSDSIKLQNTISKPKEQHFFIAAICGQSIVIKSHFHEDYIVRALILKVGGLHRQWLLVPILYCLNLLHKPPTGIVVDTQTCFSFPYYKFSNILQRALKM